MNLGAVIIAAGYSSRMKAFKPLLKIGKKTALALSVILLKLQVSGKQQLLQGLVEM